MDAAVVATFDSIGVGNDGIADRSKLIGVLVKLGLFENVELVGDGIVNALLANKRLPELPLPEKMVRSIRSLLLNDDDADAGDNS